MLAIQKILLTINSEAKITNPNTNIYSCLEQSSTDKISFIDENEESSESTSFLNKLKATRIANINRLMIGHININSIRNKFEMLSNSIKGNLDILMISETKLDSTFPSNQFTIEGYAAPIRFDRNGRGGGIILYIREDIPARLLKTSLPKDFEGFFDTVLLRAIYSLILVWLGDHWIATCLVMIIFWLLEILIQKLAKWPCLSFVKHIILKI